MTAARLNVLHIASGDLWAGAEVQVHQLLVALHARPDVRVAAIVLNEGELSRRLAASGIDVLVLDEKALSAWQLLQQIRRRIGAFHADVVHTHRFKENIVGSLANGLSRRAACLRTVHGRSEHALSRSLRRRLLHRMDRAAALLQRAVVGVSSELCEHLRQEFPARKVFFVPNGIDPRAIAFAAAAPSSYDTPTRLNIAFVGRLVPVKRVDLFLKAAAQLNATEPGRFHFVIVGDGPLAGDMQRLAAELELAGAVDFLGFQPNSLSILKRMNCLVLTSDHEGLPMVVLEALALGIPLVGPSVGGLPEVLAGVPDHRLVAEQAAPAYAEAIRQVIRMERPGPREARPLHLPERFDISVTARQYVNLYRYLLGENVPKADGGSIPKI